MATTDSPQLAAPLATPEDISSFFAQNPNLPNIQSCTKLSGGYTNHTFRLAFEPASSASWEHQEQQIVAKSYITVSSFGAEFQLRLERAVSPPVPRICPHTNQSRQLSTNLSRTPHRPYTRASPRPAGFGLLLLRIRPLC